MGRGIESETSTENLVDNVLQKTGMTLVTNEQEGAREEIQRLAKLNKRCNQTYSCTRQPLFPSIPIQFLEFVTLSSSAC